MKKGIAVLLGKTITYRITSSLATIGIVYLTTNRVNLAMFVGISEIAIKPLIYLLHEIVWQKMAKHINKRK